MTVEMQLLRCCLRFACSEERFSTGEATQSHATTQEIQLLIRSEINWQTLIRLAIAHSTTPLLYKALTSAWPKDIDHQALKQIKKVFTLNTFRNLRLTGELQKLLTLFAENNIRAIPLKGPVLAVQAYGDIALRQFSDLDVLIHRGDFLQARDLLFSTGFSRCKTLQDDKETDERDSSLMQAFGEYSFQSATKESSADAVIVDLHCRLLTGALPILTADLSFVWNDLVSVPLLNASADSFCPENLLIYLCLHGSKDFWKKLSWVCDIAALLQAHPQMDWQYVVTQSEALKCEQMLGLGLCLMRDILEIPLPVKIDEYVASEFQKKKILQQIQQRLMSGCSPDEVQNFYLKRFYYYGQMQQGVGEQLFFYGRYLLPFLGEWWANRGGVRF